MSTYKTLTSLFTFTGVITMCLARVEVLHERRWNLVGVFHHRDGKCMYYWWYSMLKGVQHQRWCRPLLYQSPILHLEWAGRWMGIGSRGSSIHLGSAEVERWNSDAFRYKRINFLKSEYMSYRLCQSFQQFGSNKHRYRLLSIRHGPKWSVMDTQEH